eukprot:TRINITY_DN22246_c0_g1_i1.p1 TRINITY_DN22246_c0_g1~~TRINITY_DN22246_c0_g1_i1.p1  ORF type:complete len:316 (-),score=53.75 TRINITY_DN22246_c0_g1_i1:147-1094(-)
MYWNFDTEATPEQSNQHRIAKQSRPQLTPPWGPTYGEQTFHNWEPEHTAYNNDPTMYAQSFYSLQPTYHFAPFQTEPPATPTDDSTEPEGASLGSIKNECKDSKTCRYSSSGSLKIVSPISKRSASAPKFSAALALLAATAKPETLSNSSLPYYESSQGTMGTSTQPVYMHRPLSLPSFDGVQTLRHSRAFSDMDNKTAKQMSGYLSTLSGLDKIRWQSVLQATRGPEVGDRETQRRVKEAEVLGARLFGGDLRRLLSSVLSHHLEFVVKYVSTTLSTPKRGHKKVRDQLFKVLSELRERDLGLGDQGDQSDHSD